MKKAINDKLFLRINHVIWSIPWFVLAVWMLADFGRLRNEPLQLFGVLLLCVIGGAFLFKGLSNNQKSLKKTQYSPASDIFFLMFALISFVPALIIWEIIKSFKRKKTIKTIK